MITRASGIEKCNPYFQSRTEKYLTTNLESIFFDVLTNNGTIIEFQNSPIDYVSFWGRTDAYYQYSQLHTGNRPIWVFNYVMRYFYVVQKGKYTYRNRKVKWYRPTKIFDEFRDKEAPYELWFRIAPMKYPPDTNAYGYISYSDISRREPAYLKVKGIYNDSYVYGDVYTEKEFIDYLNTFN